MLKPVFSILKFNTRLKPGAKKIILKRLQPLSVIIHQ